jgi:hypothetical protein
MSWSDHLRIYRFTDLACANLKIQRFKNLKISADATAPVAIFNFQLSTFNFQLKSPVGDACPADKLV